MQVDIQVAYTLLEPEDLHNLSLFDLYVKHWPSESLYAALMARYQPINSRPGTQLPSIKKLRSHTRTLSGFSPKQYDCCSNSCVAFTGYLDKMKSCPVCGTSRFNTSGNPQNCFMYLPLIPQLRTLFCSPVTATKMRYRHGYNNPNETYSDIFDSDHYKELHTCSVRVDGKLMPFKFFSEEHEIALGLSVDGMCPFKRRKNTCWLLLIINYNLPPDERMKIDNLICIGVIPGPKCPADINSFLQPLIDELLELARGVDAVDVTQHKLFALRAHLMTIFGDIPALTKILEFIGHNGCFPCRFCLIPTVAGATSGGGSHRYCPLQQPNGFQTNPMELPLHTHRDCVDIGLSVLKAPTDSARNRLATDSGIKGVTLLVCVPSISIPGSFPVDLMHMIWQNLIPQLIELWTGEFNNLDNGLENYQIEPDVWDALCDACKPSGCTIPSAFGCTVPDPRKTSKFIAKSWNNFTILLAPHLLRRRFPDQRYYWHFVRLVKLLWSIVSFDLPCEELPAIHQGVTEWLEEYEQ
jgi:hypothetical protein